MSGICGIFNRREGSAPAAGLTGMLAALEPWGPDGEDRWDESPRLSLGCRHLHTTDEHERESNPWHHSESGAVITADALLHNRTELLAAFDLDGPASDTVTVGDAELILHAYLRWGEECPNHLEGDFAFAVWDPARQAVFAARDRFGCKPLVYAPNETHLLLGSTVGSVLGSGRVEASLNRARLADYLAQWLEGIDDEITFLEGLVRLPPSHLLVATSSTLEVRRYWQLEARPTLSLASDHEYDEAFREHFTDAVRRSLRGGTRVGTMLSGGLDSSSVTAVAAQLTSRRITSYSAIDPKSTSCVETYSARAVSDAAQTPAEWITPEDYAAHELSLEQFARTCDDAFDLNMDVPNAVYRRAHDRGAKAMLDGIDGDLVTSVSDRFFLYLLRDRQFSSLLNEFLAESRYYGSPRVPLQTLAECALPVVLSSSLWEWVRKRLRTKTIHKHLRWADVDFNHADFDLLSRRLGRLYDLELPVKDPPTLQARQIHILSSPFFCNALERYARTAGRLGIEARHPFLDRQLVEFCLTLPVAQKRRSGWEKLILRRSMRGCLPDSVRWRTNPSNLTALFWTALAEREASLTAPSSGDSQNPSSDSPRSLSQLRFSTWLEQMTKTHSSL